MCRCPKHLAQRRSRVVCQAFFGSVFDTCVLGVWCSRPILKSIVVRHTSGKVSEGVESGGIEGVKRRCASGGGLCKACHFVALLGHQNGNAHLRVPPCTWVRKTAVSRKVRAVEEPAPAASGSPKNTIASVAVIEAGPAPAVEAGPAPAVTGASASAVWD